MAALLWEYCFFSFRRSLRAASVGLTVTATSGAAV